MRLVFLSFLLFLTISAEGQMQFLEAYSFWDDRVDEWVIPYYSIKKNEDLELRLKPKWAFQKKWDEWVFEFEDKRGEIKTTWKGRDDLWELRLGNEQLSIQLKWQGDPNEWVIEEDRKKYTIKTAYRNTANAWYYKDGNHEFGIYTTNRNDPRDWIIEDQTYDKISSNVRIAMIFIVLYNSIPKN